MKGWKENITKITNYTQLPENTKKYLEKLEKLIQIPISLLSVGPDQIQTIIIKKNIFSID